MKAYDVIVVGAGPAGSSTALRLAQKGLKVAIIERGNTPGSKNMFGGMLPRCPIVENLIPNFWEEAPWERHVIKNIITFMTDLSSTSIMFETKNFDKPPYNGYTVFRPIFDKWFADKACSSGANLFTGCLVENLLRDGNAISGVKIAKEDGEIHADIVIACDGVLSLLAKKVGLCKETKLSDMALGLKALFYLPEEDINQRFNLVRRQGLVHTILGCTEGIRGGGFIYTQTESLSVGLVLHLDALKESRVAPYDIFYRFLSTDRLKRILKGANLIEYSAHLIPEGGYKSIPKLFTDGLLLAGDAAGLCYTNGINQEGMNLAITSGFLAAETVYEAFEKGDFSAKQLLKYEDRLRESFALKDIKTFEKSVDLMNNDRLFSIYPEIVGSVFEKLLQNNGKPRKKIGHLSWNIIKDSMSIKELIIDLIKVGRFIV